AVDFYGTKGGSAYAVVGGCYGTNDIIEGIDENGMYGGIRQTGDVIVNISGKTNFNRETSLSGYKSNLKGNLTINISGTETAYPTFKKEFYAMGRTNCYSSITGNTNIYVSGGEFQRGFFGGGQINGTYNGPKGYNFIGGDAYVEISGGKFLSFTNSSGKLQGDFVAAGAAGAVGDIYLKFVGNAFNIEGVTYIYSAGWGTGNKVVPKEGQRDILDLSLVTDLDTDYKNFYGAAVDETNPTVGGSVERGFDVVYPSLYDASELTVTMNDTAFKNGEKLAFSADDILTVTYANGVTAHTGASAGNVTTSSFSGTVADLCEYDALASSESAKTANAIKFYLYNTEESTVGEQITVAPAVSNPSVVVGVGNVYSAPIALTVEGLSVSGTVTNAESAVTVQLIKDEKVAYEATVEPTEGSAAYAIDFVTEGTYTLKVTSEGYNIYTKEITVTAEDLTEDVVLKAKAVFPTTGGMTASLNLIDEIKINFDYELVGMADLNINDFDPAKFGLLVWQTAKFDGTLDPTTAIHSAINTNNGDEILTGSKVVYELDENTKYPHGRWRTTTPGIPAAMWGDTITIRPFYLNEDGTYSYGRVINYSVRQYCMNKINNNKPEKALCVSILNYGAAAQTYFNYNTETMMNAELSVELQTFNWDDYKAMVDLDYSVSSTKEGELARVSTTVVPLRKGSITLNGILDYNFYANVNFEPVSVKAYFWDHEAYNNNDVLTPENVSRVVDAEWTEEHGGCYIGKYTEVPAAHMFNNVYGCLAFEAEDGSITYSGVVAYSPARYAKLNADKTGNAQILNEANLSKAIVVYGATAKEYFGV
ncbi:MAG: PEGA domain-containing protein, partial [Clostridia bacterium]|nr:PEGA domain-containing protein [Clostridia bacterium]